MGRGTDRKLQAICLSMAAEFSSEGGKRRNSNSNLQIQNSGKDPGFGMLGIFPRLLFPILWWLAPRRLHG